MIIDSYYNWIMINTIAYHGTDKNFKKIDTSRGAWFISDKVEAGEYGERIIVAEIILHNPMVSTHRENVKYGPMRLISKAKENKFDGIVLYKDEQFAKEAIYTEANHTVYIAFNNEQIKIC